MTAELVVMNGGAVAMAADSAVTLSNGNKKIQTYFSANKLFCLSYNHPVGIMLYQGISLHTVPWETIIKIYRKKIGTQLFDSLDEYVDDFLKFLHDEQDHLFPQKVQQAEFQRAIDTVMYEVWAAVENKWKAANKKQITKTFVNQRIAELAIKQTAQWFDAAHEKKILAAIDAHLRNQNVFSSYVYKNNFENLKFVLFNHLINNNHYFGYTGIVFAGFGEKDIFPCVRSFEVGGFYLGRLRVEKDDRSKLTDGQDAMVIPFAQTDMVETFMKGISPVHEHSLRSTLLDRIIKIPGETIDAISDLTDVEKLKWKKHFLKSSQNAAMQMMTTLTSYFHNSYTEKIMSGLAFLNKDELAFVAQAMLSLSTLHKKVSPGDDTVGGPIDSAVISKGDGFVWLNRKHYFRPELNPHFFTRFSQLSDRIVNEQLQGGDHAAQSKKAAND